MAVNSANINVLAYASTNVGTSSYVTLFASTPINTRGFEIVDTSGQVLKLAYGPAGSEVDFAIVPVSGQIYIPFFTDAGIRISIKSVSASATTGYNAIALIS